ncbi:MAG: hypothetical protein HRU34_04690 [Richelia sp.]|nr:hypothetical protein [Richelia sp.]
MHQPPISSQPTTPPIQLIIYLIPVIGFFPSLWTIYHHQGNREQLAASRLSITLALSWLFSNILLSTGATATSELFGLRLLILNSFLTSGYFLVNIWLMTRIIKGKRLSLPGFSNLAAELWDKYLS